MNWTLTLIGSIIGSIVLSIVGNLLTDPLKNWLAGRSLVSKHKRINELRAELDYIEYLYQNRQDLYLELAFHTNRIFLYIMMCFVLILSSIMITSIVFRIDPNISMKIFPIKDPSDISFSMFLLLIATIMFLSGLVSGYQGLIDLSNQDTTLKKLHDFDEYKQIINARIEKLSQKLPTSIE
ncbi:MAG TPA: hypothetical protein VFZ66_29340 [Herpetosiphonaceae bacterium]